MDFIAAIKSGFRNYGNFRGIATRSEYWFWILFLVLSFIALSIIESALWPTQYFPGTMMMTSGSSGNSPLSDIFGLGILVPTLAMTVRRFHDAGFSGKWLWLQAGTLVLLFIGLMGFGLGMSQIFYGPVTGAMTGWDIIGAMMLAMAPALFYGLAYSIFQLVVTLRPSKGADAGNKYAVASASTPAASAASPAGPTPATAPVTEAEVTTVPTVAAPAKPKAAPRKAAPKDAADAPVTKAPAAKAKSAPKAASASAAKKPAAKAKAAPAKPAATEE